MVHKSASISSISAAVMEVIFLDKTFLSGLLKRCTLLALVLMSYAVTSVKGHIPVGDKDESEN